MAFIIVADSKSHEIDRRELAGPVIIGRSPECDLPVRDILLSRKHCVIERLGEAWVVADLTSKNGTRVNGELIDRHVLRDSDVIRIGRTRIAFRDVPFIPAPPEAKRSRQRPADPLEAMAGTLSGFHFSNEEERALDQRVLDTFPRPKPRPADPRAYESEHVQSMLADIASSAWDSVLAEEERKVRTVLLPKPMLMPVMRALPAKPIAQPTQATPTPATSRPKRRFNPQHLVAFAYLLLSALLTSGSVWVLSWSW